MKLSLSIKILGILAISLGLVTSCSESSFDGSSSKKNKKPAKKVKPQEEPQEEEELEEGDGPPLGEEGGSTSIENPAIEVDAGSEPILEPSIDVDNTGKTINELSEDERKKYQISHAMGSSSTQQVWQVNTNNKIALYELEEDKITTKKWTYSHSGTGARTYKIESGFIFTQNGGRFLFIDPSVTPEGKVPAANEHKASGISGRVCVVSYKRGGKRYIGAGYDAGGFIEFALSDTKPHVPIWTVVRQVKVPGITTWGYSCYIDQERLVYYSQWVRGTPQAISLETLTKLDANATAPNGNFTSDNFRFASKLPSGSYAMSGDRRGHIYSAASTYTLAHTEVNDLIWITAGNQLIVAPSACMTKEKSCAANSYFTYDMNQTVARGGIGASVGPISALSDGRIAGMVRGKGDAFIFQLNDEKDVSKGIKATKIGALSGDPYMYTDFTGGTLYFTDDKIVFDLNKSDAFKKGVPVKILSLDWQSRTADTTQWAGAQLSISCYTKGGEPKFTEILKIPDAGVKDFIKIPDCRNKKIDQVELRITPEPGSRFVAFVKSINIHFYQ